MRQFWDKLNPKQKKTLANTGIVAGLLILIYGLYVGTGRGDKKVEVKKEEKEKIVTLDDDKLEKSLYSQAQIDLKKQQESVNSAIDSMRKELADFKNNAGRKNSADDKTDAKGGYSAPPIPPPPPEAQKNLFETSAPAIPANKNSTAQNKSAVPPPPPPPPGQAQADAQVGGIEVISISGPGNNAPGGNLQEKKKEGLYLPPSFMEGFLLSGVTAPTTFDGKTQPVPMIFRIKNLAILPNSLRANLKGCFVVAEGTGNLASERVKTRLLTLSCISKNGESIIDQDIKGFVVDADGQVDLKGRPVAKMGMHLARVGLAGMLGGLGQALEESAKKDQFSPISGVTNTTVDTDADSLARLGAGAGISSMAKELQQFYLQLAQQTIPVIEVGPTKRVNLVVSNGVDLQIMKRNPAQNELTAKVTDNKDAASF